MLSTIFSYILFSATVIYLFVINGRLTRQNALLDKQANDLRDLVSAIESEPDQEISTSSEPAETDQAEKPLTVESIRTALRFNGFSPEIPDTHEPGIIYIKNDNISCRVVATHLPFISLEAGFKLDEPQEDQALLHRAAGEVTQNLIIGKAYVVGEGNGVVFSAEFIGDSYVYFRDNLKQLLTVLQEANKRFFQTLDSLKKRREEEREAVFSGNCFVQDSAVAHKVQS